MKSSTRKQNSCGILSAILLRFLLGWRLLWWASPIPCCHGWATTPTTPVSSSVLNLLHGQRPYRRRPSHSCFPSQLDAAAQMDVIFDGSEWLSIQHCLESERPDKQKKRSMFGSSMKATPYGRMTVVVGTNGNDKVVGILANDDNTEEHPTVTLASGVRVHLESLAKIPTRGVSDQEAMNTMMVALAGVHCVAPRVQGIGGGGKTEELVTGKVVVLGGSDYACFAAQGLAALGSTVFLVTTNGSPNIPKGSGVVVLSPAVGNDEVGFAAHIGTFDALLDTNQDERPAKRTAFAVKDYDDEEDDATDNDIDGGEFLSSFAGMTRTLGLLQARHKCDRYVSALTASQSIVNKQGILFGPGKVKEHFSDLENKVRSKPELFPSIVSPKCFGQTVETLFEKGIVFRSQGALLTSKVNKIALRGWTLKDFMELTTWPQDSSGAGIKSIRFGMPAVEEEDEEGMISAPPRQTNTRFLSKEDWNKGIETTTKTIISAGEWEDESVQEVERRRMSEKTNPYVEWIVGPEAMHQTIVKGAKDCVLFLSASWCRTCKSLDPKFTYMARQALEFQQEFDDDASSGGLMFAKADTTDEEGKRLGRLLSVDAVPAFVLFRKGRNFGRPINISKLPSKKLNAALELLESGKDWDPKAIMEAEEA